GKTQFGARTHDDRQAIERRRCYETALVMALFRPRIGKQDKDAAERARHEAIDEETGVVGEDADIGEALRGDVADQPSDAVFEDLRADKTDIGMRHCLDSEMLAAAKADLEPDLARRWRKQHSRVERLPLGQGERESRQQARRQPLAARPQRASAAAAIKPALGRWIGVR